MRCWSARWIWRQLSTAFTGLGCLQWCSSLHRLCCQWYSAQTGIKRTWTLVRSRRALPLSCPGMVCDRETPSRSWCSPCWCPLACEKFQLVPYLDTSNFVGKLSPVAGAFRRLYTDDATAKGIRLAPNTSKCGIFGVDMEMVAIKAAKVSIDRQLCSMVSSQLACMSSQHSTPPTPWGTWGSVQ